METCRICVSPASPKRIGSLFTPHFFWILLVLSSFFTNFIHCTSKNPSSSHEQQQCKNHPNKQHCKNNGENNEVIDENNDEDDNEFAEFDGEMGAVGSEKSKIIDQNGGRKKSSRDEEQEEIKTKNEQKNDFDQEEDDFLMEDSQKEEKIDVDSNKNAKIAKEKVKFQFDNNDLSIDEDLEGLVEDEVDEDVEDFVSGGDFDKKTKRAKSSEKSTLHNAEQQSAQLKITDVPAHLRNNWSNFQVELVMLFGLIIYLVNYALGKNKNHKLATTWFECNREILYNNFEVVGDDGTTQEIQKNILMKESDHVYSLWCTGRPGCQGSLIQLKLLKRQDLVALVIQLFKPQSDKVCIRFNLNGDDLDSCILCFGNRKTVAKLFKETTDLSQYCTEKKNVDRLGLPDSFGLYAEAAEVTNGILDSKTVAVIQKYEQLIDYIHISDQYCGLKANDAETPQTKLPETSRVAIFQFNIPGRLHANEKSIQDLAPLLAFSFYCTDKIRRFRLSREAKQKCDKNRLMAQESYLKQTHAQRQEAAQTRREEKARERKERVLLEEDPEKQRRLEKLEQKREQKKKQPRIKQLKIKAG